MSSPKNIIFIILMLCSNFALAQFHSYGIKVGINYTNITGYFPYISNYKTGLSIGGFADYRFSERVYIELQTLFEQKGYGFEHHDFVNNTKTYGERYYDYLITPFIFKYQFGNVIKFNLKLGTYLGILLNAQKEETEYDYSVSPPDETYLHSSIIHKTASIDMGFSFGFGVQRNITKKNYILIEAMLNSGFMLIEPNNIFVEETRHKTFSLSFGLGHYF